MYFRPKFEIYMKRLLLFSTILCLNIAFAQQKSVLTVEKIMRDPKWMGSSPEDIFWGSFDDQLYFRWNREANDYASLYSVSIKEHTPKKRGEEEVSSFVSQISYSNDGQQAVFVKRGDIFLQNSKSKKERQLTSTVDKEADPQFNADENAVIFKKGDNLFAISLLDGELKQLTNFTKAIRKKKTTNFLPKINGLRRIS